MSNEELVAAIQAGEDRMGELWEQVERLVQWKANRIMTALKLVAAAVLIVRICTNAAIWLWWRLWKPIALRMDCFPPALCSI